MGRGDESLSNGRLYDPRRPDVTQPCVCATVLLEVIVAAAIVVGSFAAACQSISWSSVIQLLFCASLGALLWCADKTLAVEDADVRETSQRWAPLP